MSTATTPRQHQHIGGAWVDAVSGQTRPLINPATEEPICQLPAGDREDCLQAIAAARHAQRAWASRTAYERAAVLRAAADSMRAAAPELAKVTTAEAGKPLAEATGEWRVVADLFDWYAEECKRAYGRTIPSRVGSKRMQVSYQPVGVVGVITAWNFPAYNPARSWAAALAAGCAVVARPSDSTPLTALLMAEHLHDAGLPAGVLNVVLGSADPIAQAMLDSEDCRHISFTGSVGVGRRLMEGAGRTFTRLSLELGGNAPVLVFGDVDVDAVAKAAVAARFRNAGQVCVAPQRFLVHESIAEAFARALVPHVAKLKVGNGLDPATRIGPLITAKQRDRIERLVTGACEGGATLLAGGKRPSEHARGYFFEPTVLDGVRRDMDIYHEEIFGPVLPVTTFTDIDEAIETANSTPYGLAAYVFTRDLNTAMRASEALDFGIVGVNELNAHATEAPFSGRKHSGLGAESGQEGLYEYMETKLVSIGGL